jgi:hypothetical protein
VSEPASSHKNAVVPVKEELKDDYEAMDSEPRIIGINNNISNSRDIGSKGVPPLLINSMSQ